MLGAILGDIVGSPFEFDQGKKTKDFGPLFSDNCGYVLGLMLREKEAVENDYRRRF